MIGQWAAVAFVVLVALDFAVGVALRRVEARERGRERVRFGCVVLDFLGDHSRNVHRPPEVFRHYVADELVGALLPGELMKYTTHRAGSLSVGDALFTRTVVAGEEYRTGDLLVICTVERWVGRGWRRA